MDIAEADFARDVEGPNQESIKGKLQVNPLTS
jgi:hypothetical protein